MIPPRAPPAHTPAGRFPSPLIPHQVRSVLGALFLLSSVGYAAWASGAAPFTRTSELAVAVPSVLFALLALVWRRARRVGSDRSWHEDEGSALPWIGALCVLVAVELASYFHPGPRADYPTLSSGLDVLFHARAAKAAGWWVWIAVAWGIVRR